MKEGKILSTVGGVYDVYDGKDIISCSPKGTFRKSKITPYVGDNVIFDENKKIIEEIKPRLNEIIRPKMANIDLAFVLVSLKQPSFSKELLNLFLTFLNKYNIKSQIIFTKTDLVDDLPTELMNYYNFLGYKCFFFSTKNHTDTNILLDEIKGKTIAFVGQTGVGKSSLINYLLPGANQRIGSYSDALGRGKHQTTKNQIIPFNGTFICDTPGFSSIEIKCYKEELKDYYPAFTFINEECGFKDCLHLSESNCRIKDAVKNGIIMKEDYELYVRLLDHLPYRKDRFSK